MPEGHNEQWDFFVSYAHADQAWAEWIAWQLERAGLRVCLQAWDFRAGTNFILAMQKAAANSLRTIAVLSSDYLASDFGAAEWAAAYRRDPAGESGRLVPVRVRPCELEGIFAPIAYVDLVGCNREAATEKLLSTVRWDRAKPATEPAFPGQVEPVFPGGAEQAEPAWALDAGYRVHGITLIGDEAMRAEVLRRLLSDLFTSLGYSEPTITREENGTIDLNGKHRVEHRTLAARCVASNRPMSDSDVDAFIRPLRAGQRLPKELAAYLEHRTG